MSTLFKTWTWIRFLSSIALIWILLCLTWTLVHLVHDLKAFFSPEVLIFQNSARNNFKQNLLKNAGQLANTFLRHLYPTQFEVAAWQSNAWAVDEACLMASYGSFMRNPPTLQLYCPSNYITDSPVQIPLGFFLERGPNWWERVHDKSFHLFLVDISCLTSV